MLISVLRKYRPLWLILSGLLLGLTLIFPKVGILEWIALVPAFAIMLDMAADGGVKYKRLYWHSFFLFEIFSRARNRAARTRIKNVVKAVRAAIKNNDKAAADAALVTATSTLTKIAGKGVIHWKNAARKVSRLAKAVNGIEA